MRLAHGSFRLGRQLRPGEDESQITSRLGQRFEQLILLRRDADVLDVRHRTRPILPATDRSTPRRGMGIIITAAASSSRFGTVRSPRA